MPTRTSTSRLICGSIAYDNIMVFEDSFKNHILPDQIHILNVAFLVPEMRREFGGCAINIAYNLKLLGQDPLPMATAGKDFAPYRDWLDRQGIRQDHIRLIDDVLAPGYGHLNPATRAAIETAAQTEALILDPVYSGKAMAGFLNRAAAAAPGRSLLFIHTGGTPAIFAYRSLAAM